MFYLRHKILVPGAKPFKQGKPGDAGYDIWALKGGLLLPFTTIQLRTGIATAFPRGWTGLIFDRGSTGSKGIMRKCGVVDSNFRDEWNIFLYNTGPTHLTIEGVLENPNAKACAQVVFVPHGDGESEEMAELPESDRKSGQWMGSSDANS